MLSIAVNLKKVIKSYFFKYNISKNSKIAIAFSGGADSIALAILLKNYLIEPPILLYYNHNLRAKKELEREILFIQNFAKQEDLALLIENGFLLKEEAIAKKESLESLARSKRYAFFYKILKEYNIEYLALGHHKDDIVETLLMRQFQGYSFSLKGIIAYEAPVIRPLLGVFKNEILEYLEFIKQGYSLDSTNLESDFLRNKIRNQLVPKILEIFPSFKESILNNYKQEEEKYNYLTKHVPVWEFIEEGLYLLKNYEEYPFFLLKESIFKIYNLCFKDYPTLEKRLKNRFLDNFKLNEKEKRYCVLRHRNFYILKDNKSLFFKSTLVKNSIFDYAFKRALKDKIIFDLKNYCLTFSLIKEVNSVKVSFNKQYKEIGLYSLYSFQKTNKLLDLSLLEQVFYRTLDHNSIFVLESEEECIALWSLEEEKLYRTSKHKGSITYYIKGKHIYE